jgi:cellulose synthase/poly-beta-1,6-N-acetylglucosamine synthase-like glycosyltransferase
MTTLFLSTPCYGGLCLQAYAESLFALQNLASKEGVAISLDFTGNESLVHRARNTSIARFLYKSTCDFFMFIDADIQFDPQSVMRLLKSGHDCAVAAYPKKGIFWDQAAEAVLSGDTRDPSKLSSSLVLNFKDQGKTSITNGFVEVLDGPTGFMLIKRSVIEAMYKHYPELNCVNDHQNRDCDTYCAIFDCMIDPESRRYLSEDYAFCRRWQQMGGKIHADVTTTLGHVGNIRFCGELHKALTPQKI